MKGRLRKRKQPIMKPDAKLRKMKPKKLLSELIKYVALVKENLDIAPGESTVDRSDRLEGYKANIDSLAKLIDIKSGSENHYCETRVKKDPVYKEIVALEEARQFLEDVDAEVSEAERNKHDLLIDVPDDFSDEDDLPPPKTLDDEIEELRAAPREDHSEGGLFDDILADIASRQPETSTPTIPTVKEEESELKKLADEEDRIRFLTKTLGDTYKKCNTLYFQLLTVDADKISITLNNLIIYLKSAIQTGEKLIRAASTDPAFTSKVATNQEALQYFLTVAQRDEKNFQNDPDKFIKDLALRPKRETEVLFENIDAELEELFEREAQRQTVVDDLPLPPPPPDPKIAPPPPPPLDDDLSAAQPSAQGAEVDPTKPAPKQPAPKVEIPKGKEEPSSVPRTAEQIAQEQIPLRHEKMKAFEERINIIRVENNEINTAWRNHAADETLPGAIEKQAKVISDLAKEIKDEPTKIKSPTAATLDVDVESEKHKAALLSAARNMGEGVDILQTGTGNLTEAEQQELELKRTGVELRNRELKKDAGVADTTSKPVEDAKKTTSIDEELDASLRDLDNIDQPKARVKEEEKAPLKPDPSVPAPPPPPAPVIPPVANPAVAAVEERIDREAAVIARNQLRNDRLKNTAYNASDVAHTAKQLTSYYLRLDAMLLQTDQAKYIRNLDVAKLDKIDNAAADIHLQLSQLIDTYETVYELAKNHPEEFIKNKKGGGSIDIIGIGKVACPEDLTTAQGRYDFNAKIEAAREYLQKIDGIQNNITDAVFSHDRPDQIEHAYYTTSVSTDATEVNLDHGTREQQRQEAFNIASRHLRTDPNIGPAGNLNNGHFKIRTTAPCETRVIPMQITVKEKQLLSREPLIAKTVTIQTTQGDTCRSEFLFDDAKLFNKVSRMRSGITSIPGMPTMEWAANNVNSFLAKMPDKNGTVHIDTARLPKEMTEALILYCKFKGLKYSAPVGFSMSEKQSDKQVELFAKKWAEKSEHRADIGVKKELELEEKTIAPSSKPTK